jgi:hypothetical protein
MCVWPQCLALQALFRYYQVISRMVLYGHSCILCDGLIGSKCHEKDILAHFTPAHTKVFFGPCCAAPAPAPAAGTGVHPAPQLVHDASATLGNLSHPRGNSHPVSAAHQARVDPSTLAGTLGEAHRTQGESATDQWVYSGPSTPVGEKVQPPWSSSGTASLSVSKVTLHRRQRYVSR